MPTTIQLRRGTAAQWTSANPTLAAGEIGLETDTDKRKIGDGVQAWTALDYDLTKSVADDLYAEASLAGEVATKVTADGAVTAVVAASAQTQALAIQGMEPARTLSVIGDLHFGHANAAAQPSLNVATTDLATLDAFYAKRLYVGDLVDSYSGPNDTLAQAFIDALDADGNWFAVAGNHDLSAARDAASWATTYGLPAANWVEDFGFCRVIGLSPDDYSPSNELSTTTLTYLETQLKTSAKDTIILCHFPLFGTVAQAIKPDLTWSGSSTFGAPESDALHVIPTTSLLAILDKYPHARAWISGHTHSPQDAPDLYMQRWTGSRYIAHINAGHIVDRGEGRAPRSPFITVHPDRLEIRVRNHASQTWETYKDAYTTTIPYGADALARTGDNPAAFVFVFDNTLAGTTRSGALTATFTGTVSYDTVGDETGAECGTGEYITLPTAGLLFPDRGGIAIRYRHTASSGDSRILYHNPGGSRRLYLARKASDGKVRMTVGAGSVADSYSTPGDTNLHTVGISWRDGRAWLFLDGLRQNVSIELMTEALQNLILGDGGNSVVYGVYGAGRELSQEEHAWLHNHPTGWSWTGIA